MLLGRKEICPNAFALVHLGHVTAEWNGHDDGQHQHGNNSGKVGIHNGGLKFFGSKEYINQVPKYDHTKDEECGEHGAFRFCQSDW